MFLFEKCSNIFIFVYFKQLILGKWPTEKKNYIFNAPTTFSNTKRLLRALKLNKALLLEGSPGVGKTSLISSLAEISG